LRFDPRAAATAVALVSALAVTVTVGPLQELSREARNAQLVLLQAFMGVMSVTILVLAAVVAERRRGEERLRELAITDPLTGLANYRQLVVALAAEMQRSQRTERPFALLFFDLDGLKGINDRHGHLVGSRALCQVADAIRHSCRAIDTPARYGGDEFAVILPRTDKKGALRVCERLRQQIRNHPFPGAGGAGVITASFGISSFPQDGKSSRVLLRKADRALYRAKARGRDAVST
jgi:diguanylate cyclase (GGDEF)-like protein